MCVRGLQSLREKKAILVVLATMTDYSHVGNGSYADKSLVKATEISQVVITVQGPREMLQDGATGLPALPDDSTFKKGQLRQAPSYLLGKPLHDFDATGNGVSTDAVYNLGSHTFVIITNM